MSFVMKPYAERTPDMQYRNFLRYVLENGIRSKTPAGVDTFSVIAPQPMHFNLNANGSPIITERKIGFWRQPVGEICAFINGVHTIQGLREFGCTYWDKWDSPEVAESTGIEQGDLGPGSYGVAFHDFPTGTGETFNQFKHLIQQIKDFPHLKTHHISPWIPYYAAEQNGVKRQTFIAPCHGWVWVRILERTLHLCVFQRSADVPIGVPSNLVQYSALALILAHLTGYEEVRYSHMFFDAHVYEDQLQWAERILSREPRPFPTLSLTDEGHAITDIHDFRAEHFALTDYNPHPAIKGIPAAL